SRVLARLSMRQMALSASGVRKKDHIVDPRTGEPVRGRLAAWVALPRPAPGSVEGPRLAAAAVADALTTAMMMLSLDEVASLCEHSPGLQAWVLPDAVGPSGEADLLHFGGQA